MKKITELTYGEIEDLLMNAPEWSYQPPEAFVDPRIWARLDDKFGTVGRRGQDEKGAYISIVLTKIRPLMAQNPIIEILAVDKNADWATVEDIITRDMPKEVFVGSNDWSHLIWGFAHKRNHLQDEKGDYIVCLLTKIRPIRTQTPLLSDLLANVELEVA